MSTRSIIADIFVAPPFLRITFSRETL